MNLSRFKIIAVCGKPQSGKDTLSEILAYHTGKDYGTCSDVIYANLANTLRMEESELMALPKEDIRHLLVAHGNWLTSYNKSYLIDSLILGMGKQIICGVRRLAELDSLFKNYDSVIAIWVERPGNPEIKDNTEIFPEVCTIRILNDGTIEDLEKKVKELL